jgi:hypothetical protein
MMPAESAVMAPPSIVEFRWRWSVLISLLPNSEHGYWDLDAMAGIFDKLTLSGDMKFEAAPTLFVPSVASRIVTD